jgi:hypothetical protein
LRPTTSDYSESLDTTVSLQCRPRDDIQEQSFSEPVYSLAVVQDNVLHGAVVHKQTRFRRRNMTAEISGSRGPSVVLSYNINTSKLTLTRGISPFYRNEEWVPVALAKFRVETMVLCSHKNLCIRNFHTILPPPRRERLDHCHR